MILPTLATRVGRAVGVIHIRLHSVIARTAVGRIALGLVNNTIRVLFSNVAYLRVGRLRPTVWIKVRGVFAVGNLGYV